MEADFREMLSSSGKKRGAADAFEKNLSFISKATVLNLTNITKFRPYLY
jgi:hypothetical protein